MAKQPAAAKAATEGKTQARLLSDCQYGKTNDVVELTPEELEQAEAAGQADSTPAAVDYALSLQAEKADE